jgi:hypothetical protein
MNYDKLNLRDGRRQAMAVYRIPSHDHEAPFKDRRYSSRCGECKEESLAVMFQMADIKKEKAQLRKELEEVLGQEGVEQKIQAILERMQQEQ